MTQSAARTPAAPRTPTITDRFATPDPTLCAVCRRAAMGLGFTPHANAPILWLCDDPDCLHLGRSVYRMPTPTLDAIEVRARNAALEAVGGYLDKIETTDLAALTPDEFFEVGNVFVRTFETEMRRLVSEQVAPF